MPVALALDLVVHASPVAVFVTSALGIVPLAGLMGRATDRLATRFGEGIGGLLNATFGNAAELIIAGLAVHAGLYDLVKATITGSIIGNILLVFGLSAFIGGLRRPAQRFNRTAASMAATLLILSAIGLVVPALFHLVSGAGDGTEQDLSLEIAIVLMATYIVSLFFTLRTHRYLYAGPADDAEPGSGAVDAPRRHRPSAWGAVLLLLASTAGVAVMAELLVGATDVTARQLGWNEVFVGVILLAIIGNAAEHSTAVLMAIQDRMDAALNIAIGSSIQVALFVAPLLVFLSYAIGPHPMDLIFTTMEVVSVIIAVTVISAIADDGESNYMEGVQLLAVYLILGMAFFAL